MIEVFKEENNKFLKKTGKNNQTVDEMSTLSKS